MTATSDRERDGGSRKMKDRSSGGLTGALWLIGWLFTIGFCHLAAKQALLGIFIWAYYLGAKLAGNHP